MANRRRRTFQEMCADLRMRDAEALFARARIASGVAKVAFGSAGRAVAYSIKERCLAAMIKLVPFPSSMKSDRAADRYRLCCPFGEIHYLRRVM